MVENGTASGLAYEAGRALIPGGLTTSVFGVAGGLWGAELFKTNGKTSCPEVSYETSTSMFPQPSSCKVTLDMPVIGEVYSAQQAGMIMGVVIAVVVGLIALGFVWKSKRAHI